MQRMISGFTITILILAFVIAAQNITSPSSLIQGPYEKANKMGNITDKKINEISGIAHSWLRDEQLWIINDSDNEASIYAINYAGDLLAEVRISGAENRDWEDLTSFRLGDTSYLLIADVGDNDEFREYCYLHIVKEPVLEEIKAPVILNQDIIKTIKFYYEDGARDCEAVAVDLKNKEIILISKYDFPSRVYVLPLELEKDNVVYTAELIGLVTNIPKPTLEEINMSFYNSFNACPTSMDISEDASAAIVLTYKNAYYYKRGKNETWNQAFAYEPKLVTMPKLKQAESICFAAKSQDLFVTSEKLPAPLLHIIYNNN
jgi:hypothetical protein